MKSDSAFENISYRKNEANRFMEKELSLVKVLIWIHFPVSLLAGLKLLADILHGDALSFRMILILLSPVSAQVAYFVIYNDTQRRIAQICWWYSLLYNIGLISFAYWLLVDFPDDIFVGVALMFILFLVFAGILLILSITGIIRHYKGSRKYYNSDLFDDRSGG